MRDALDRDHRKLLVGRLHEPRLPPGRHSDRHSPRERSKPPSHARFRVMLRIWLLGELGWRPTDGKSSSRARGALVRSLPGWRRTRARTSAAKLHRSSGPRSWTKRASEPQERALGYPQGAGRRCRRAGRHSRASRTSQSLRRSGWTRLSSPSSRRRASSNGPSTFRAAPRWRARGRLGVRVPRRPPRGPLRRPGAARGDRPRRTATGPPRPNGRAGGWLSIHWTKRLSAR